MCFDDALDDGQAEADTCVIGPYACGAALKGFDKRRSLFWREPLACVLHGEHHGLGVKAGRDPHGAMFGQVVDDRVVQEVHRHLQQERGRSDRRGDVADGLDSDAPILSQRQERFGGLFGDQRQVDLFSGEGPLIGAAEEE